MVDQNAADTRTEAPSPVEELSRPRIVRGHVETVSLYEITDRELELLEQGSANPICLNFAVFFISVAVTLLTTLATVRIDSTLLFIVFAVVTTVGFAGGGALLILWFHSRSRLRDVVERIKARICVDR